VRTQGPEDAGPQLAFRLAWHGIHCADCGLWAVAALHPASRTMGLPSALSAAPLLLSLSFSVSVCVCVCHSGGPRSCSCFHRQVSGSTPTRRHATSVLSRAQTCAGGRHSQHGHTSGLHLPGRTVEPVAGNREFDKKKKKKRERERNREKTRERIRIYNKTEECKNKGRPALSGDFSPVLYIFTMKVNCLSCKGDRDKHETFECSYCLNNYT
jgi:hypothetical protein